MTLYAQILSNRQFLSISGKDAASFLQGLITNDIYKTDNIPLIYTALLNPKGRYVHDFFILKQEDNYIIDICATKREDLFKRLSMFKLNSSVEIEKFDNEIGVAAIWGETSTLNQGYPDPRVENLGYRIYEKLETLENIVSSHKKGDYLYYLFKKGIPESGKGLIQEKTIPLEANMDQLNAISFKKGCYMGQELTARTHHQGLIRKRLLPFKVQEHDFSEGILLTKEGCELGTILSQYKDLGFARVKLEKLKELDDSFPVYIPDWLCI